MLQSIDKYNISCSDPSAIDKYNISCSDPSAIEYDNDKMLAWMMHEIRNPVTLINCSLQFIETSNPTLKSDRHWLRLNQDMDSLLLLLKDYSTFSHCQILNRSNSNLLDMVSGILESFEIIAREKDIALFIEKDTSFSCILNYYCDAVKIKEVLINIVKNALEAVSQDGQVTISFRPPGTLEGRGTQLYLIIDVKNNGPAIDGTLMERITDPFVTTKKDGTGIGLFIVKKVLEAHNGFLTVRSDSRETCFSVCLPHPI